MHFLVFFTTNNVLAKPENIPQIVSFNPSEEYTRCINLVWDSISTETIEVMNNTTQKLYKFEGATGYTFQGLTKDKTYEVMIRSCDRVDNLYDCTNWSPVKSATAKEILYNVGNVVLSNTNFVYDGKVKKPTVIVKNDKNVTLKEGKDYKITYISPSAINKGTYKVVVTGLDNYKFTKELTYKILPAGVKDVSLSKTSYTYNGKIKKPTVKVINNKGTTLVKNKDYTITYPSGRTNVGTYTVKVKGKGNYDFNRKLKFKINKPTTDLLSGPSKLTKSISSSPFSLNIKSRLNKKIHYKSSDTSIAYVTSSGKVYVNDIGNANITAYTIKKGKEKDASKTIKIKVTKRESVPTIGEAAAVGNNGLGDGSGREVRTKKWYKNNSYGNWNYVFRFKDPRKAEIAADAMIEACKNDKIGYDNRTKSKSMSFTREVKKVGWDPSKIKNKCATACSQGVLTIVQVAGYHRNNSDYAYKNAASGANTLKRDSNFRTITDTSYTNHYEKLRRGDILVDTKGTRHMIMVVK